ncbi:unnamed protein product [Allacma fusca]|uniref:Uncharacterized protein n=1 Tax=Allacma fusca TaxID=39272 RepID=A0A8J2JLU9_9HEXA|nr:unnamed protein product [Allacma fusca]
MFLVTVSYDNIPVECRAEVQAFTTKLLTSSDPAVKIFSLRLNRNFVRVLRNVAVIIGMVIITFIYVTISFVIAMVQHFDDWLQPKSSNASITSSLVEHLARFLNLD